MNVVLRQFIDVQGRLRVLKEGKLELVDYEYPPLIHQFRCKHNADRYLLTADGMTYDSKDKVVHNLSHQIVDLINIDDNRVIILDNNGRLSRVLLLNPYEITEITVDIAYLLGVNVRDGIINILIITRDSQWKEISTDGELIREFYGLPNIDSIRQISNRYVITDNGYVRYYIDDNEYNVSYHEIGYQARDITPSEDIWVDRYYPVDMILDNDGLLLCRWINSAGEVNGYQCTNKKLLEYNNQYRWVRFSNLFAYYIALINDIGQIFTITDEFLASTTNLPTDIFSVPLSKTKSARNKI